MPRTVLKVTDNKEPLPPHEQSLLNSVVYSKLCCEEVFSLIKGVDTEQRGEALRIALDWGINHCLVDDEEQEVSCDV